MINSPRDTGTLIYMFMPTYVCFVYIYVRNSFILTLFVASQKGTIGRLEDPENMPFSASTGMIPDVIMSPIGFTSRMTIGKLIEAISGKAVCVSADFDVGVDSQCFEDTAEAHVQKACELLRKHGYADDGTELFIDGITGEMIKARVMSGVVSYVKLNHMVSKKTHARSTGPIHLLTRQPNEGRRQNGGLRFGPMEVECTVAHSASEVLRERTFTTSDRYEAPICGRCGFICDANQCLGTRFCRVCKDSTYVRMVSLPYTTKLMCQELNATGVKIAFKLDDVVD